MIGKDLSAAIMAGGKSRRFGEPKALALFKGKRLVDYAVEQAARIATNAFLVNGRTVSFENVEIPIIPDIIPEIGPIGGLYTALKHSATPLLAALPVDTPLLPTKIYQILYDRLEDDRPSVALSDKGLEPLISIWPLSILPLVERQIRGKNYSLRALFQKKKAIVVDFPKLLSNYDSQIFLNINYKKDLQITS